MATSLSVAPSLLIAPSLPITIKTGRNLGQIARSELPFLLSFTLAVGALTSLPYAIGQFMSSRETVFTGMLTHSLDTNNYLAYVQQAASGKWLFRNPMTPEAHAAVFFNLEWLIAGKIASAFHVSLATATDIQRLLSLGLMCFGVYWLAAHLFRSTLIRRAALTAVMAGGGLGWVAALHVLHIPLDSSYFLDLSNGNLFPFYWALKLPHFLASESFVVLGLAFFLRGECTGRIRDYAAAGAGYMAAGACRPYDMLYLMAATGLFVALRFLKQRPTFSQLLLRSTPILMCGPVLAYYFWIFKVHAIFHWWSFPGNAAPAPWLLAFGFGPCFFLFLWSLNKLAKTRITPAAEFMICCFVTATLLTYMHHWLHFAFQFATNMLLPMVMLTLFALEKPITEWKARARWASALMTVLLIVNCFTSLALTAQAAWLVRKGDFRVDAALVDAYSWLNIHSGFEDVVLADFDNSNQLPQYTHNVVFCGYINAVNFNQKWEDLQHFLKPDTSIQFRQHLLRQYGVRFLLLNPTEARNFAQLENTSMVKEVFRNSAAVVLVVNREALGA